MENTIIVAMAMAVAITNIILLMKILSSEKKADAKTSGAKDGQTEISIMGKTKTQVTVENIILPERKQDRIPVPTEEPEEGSTEIGEEFYPDMDEVDEEEVEMEDLLAAAGKDIRLDSTDLIAQEISGLQKMRGREDIPEEEKEGIRSAISKLDGSEFLRMLKENEEKAEKRNRELLKMIEELDNPPMKTGRKSAAGQEKENISLEDFL